MRAKQRNDEKFNNRVREKELKMQIEEENRQKYMNDRVQRQAIKEKTIKAIKKSKNEDYKFGKTMTVQNTQFKKEFNNEVQKQNNKRKEKVKDEAAMRAERLRQLEEMKKSDNQVNYNTRVEEEKQRIMENEKRIKKMEKLEAELLSKLKNSQQMEQNAYSTLENALKVSNEACDERKKKQVMVRKPRPKEIKQAKNASSAQESQSVNGTQE